MTTYIAYLWVTILLFGAAFHFYWGVGGRIGYEASIPRRSTGERLFTPPNWGAHLVGIILVAAAWLVLAIAQIVSFPMPLAWIRVLVMLMAIGCIIRATWATSYCGLFKSVRHSAFAHYDTVLYSPLLLILGIGLLTIL